MSSQQSERPNPGGVRPTPCCGSSTVQSLAPAAGVTPVINRRRCLLAFGFPSTAALMLSAGLFVAPSAGAQPTAGAQPAAAPATSPTTVPTLARPLAPNSATKTSSAGAFSPTIINKFI